MTRLFAALLLTLTLTLSAAAQSAPPSGKRPFTFEDMMALKRISDPAAITRRQMDRLLGHRCESRGEHAQVAALDCARDGR
jgi:hypothetical protein